LIAIALSLVLACGTPIPSQQGFSAGFLGSVLARRLGTF
jgi:hypothetical protein